MKARITLFPAAALENAESRQRLEALERIIRSQKPD